MSEQDSDSIQVEVRIRAKPEVIFPFFTDPEKIVLWQGTEATLDARPGGVYRVHVAGRYMARGEFVSIEPNKRVVFTWGWEDEGHPVPPGSSTVEVTLHPEGDSTIVRLRHSGLSVEQAQEHKAGWGHYLPRLVERAEGRDPGPDPMMTGATGMTST